MMDLEKIIDFLRDNITLVDSSDMKGLYRKLHEISYWDSEFQDNVLALTDFFITTLGANNILEVVTDLPDFMFSIQDNMPDNITINDSIKSLGQGVFTMSNIKNVTMGANVKSIGDDCFSHCNLLETVKLNEGLQTIGDSAFEYCKKLQSINIPSSLTSLNADVFLKDINCIINYNGSEEDFKKLLTSDEEYDKLKSYIADIKFAN